MNHALVLNQAIDARLWIRNSIAARKAGRRKRSQVGRTDLEVALTTWPNWPSPSSSPFSYLSMSGGAHLPFGARYATRLLALASHPCHASEAAT